MRQHERGYLERTVATVRIHRDAENCWPQWANIFADEIERLWQVEVDSVALRDGIVRACEESDYCYACDCHPSHGHASTCPLHDDAGDADTA